jgi:predicted ABC-class ATPase
VREVFTDNLLRSLVMKTNTKANLVSTVAATSNLDKLVALKTQVIQFHDGSENEYVRINIARDACYTSKNSVDFKLNQMSDIRAELSDLADSGSDVVNSKIAQKIAMYRRMEDELEQLEFRHKADLAVHLDIVGELWTHKPKRTFKSDGLGVDSELSRILGKK